MTQDSFHDIVRQIQRGGVLDPLQAEAAKALTAFHRFVKDVAETSPHTFMRGDDPNSIIDDAKDLLADWEA